jgi:DNA-binding NarL/FixJ family response regulator
MSASSGLLRSNGSASAVKVRIFSDHASVFALCEHALRDRRQINSCPSLHAEVGLIDGQLSRLESQLLILRLRFPALRLLLLLLQYDDNDCLRWISRGIRGVVKYEQFDSELASALKEVATGSLWFPPSVVKRWNHLKSRAPVCGDPFCLTPRERQVVQQLLYRMSNKEIATQLCVTERTIKFHVGNVLAKLRLRSRYDLMIAPCNLNGCPFEFRDIYCMI